MSVQAFMDQFDMRVVFTGGRSYPDDQHVATVCGGLVASFAGKRVLFAHGGARGLDSLVDAWTKRVQAVLPAHVAPALLSFPAHWHELGKAAGPIRNREMLDTVKPHLVLAFDGGSGTHDCCSAAIDRQIPVIEADTLQRMKTCCWAININYTKPKRKPR